LLLRSKRRFAMITLQLSREDAGFLRGQLEQQLGHVENELVHTDQHQMQHELARDLERLRAMVARLKSATDEERVRAPVVVP
jgi:tRNA isopentenyl-2-thiomethyl-A-37 hydroxylase MiaE